MDTGFWIPDSRISRYHASRYAKKQEGSGARFRLLDVDDSGLALCLVGIKLALFLRFRHLVIF